MPFETGMPDPDNLLGVEIFAKASRVAWGEKSKTQLGAEVRALLSADNPQHIAAWTAAVRAQAFEEAAQCAEAYGADVLLFSPGSKAGTLPNKARVPLRGEHVAAGIRALAVEAPCAPEIQHGA